MILKDNFFLKLLLFIITATLVTPPFNYWIKVFFLSLAVVIIFSSKIDTENIKKKIILIPFIVLICIKFYSQSYSLIINHIVLPTQSTANFNYIKNNFNKDMYLILNEELEKISEKEILLDNIKQPGESKRSTKHKKFAFQVENIWTNLEEGKYVFIKNHLNFWDLGPSALNDVDLNFGDKNKPNYQTNLNFPVLFKINFKEINNGSQLCFKGNLILRENDKYLKKFFKKTNCLEINYKNDYYFLDYNRDLELEIKKNLLYDNLDIIFLLSFILIFLIFLIFYKEINYFYLSTIVFFYFVVFLYFKFGLKPISGYSEFIYFDRGMDGMAHYGFARVILTNFFLGEISNSLIGSEEIFFYMPLMRYINSILMIFFGDNILGVIFLISFFPIIIFKTLNIFLNSKNSKILTLIFIFFPIFESLGFTIINYISYSVDGYGEGITYLLVLLNTYLFLIKDNRNSNFFLIGLFSFIIVGLRPNYIIFCSSLIFSYILYLISKKKIIQDYKLKIFFLIFGFSFILLIPFHNYIYGNEFVLLIKSDNFQNSYHVKISDYFLLFKSVFQLNPDFELLEKVLKHLNHYIKFYELWFLLTLLNLIFVVFSNFIIKLRILAFCLLLMHSTFFFFLGDPRYSMGTWLSTFIVFIATFKSIYYSRFFLKVKFFLQNSK